MAQTCVVFSCQSCGNREAVSSEEYAKTYEAQQPSLKTLSGKTIIYRPVPDCFVCPQCGGEMFLDNCTVDSRPSEEWGTVISVEAVHEPVEAFNNEQQRLKQAEEHEAIIKRMVEMIQPLIESNVKYLERMEGKHFLNDVFHTDPKDRPNISLVNQITRFIGYATKWSCERAEDLAVSVLEDVNMHAQAKAVKDLLKSMEKQGC